MALIIAALQARLGIEAGRRTEKDMAKVAARSRVAARGGHRRMGHQSLHPRTTSTKRRRAKLAPRWSYVGEPGAFQQPGCRVRGPAYLPGIETGCAD